jgi:AcrR family transcriptional regulator
VSAPRWLRDERAELAADRILEAAGALFAERGVHAVGMSEVAEAAGCSRATLYRYFDGRDALRTAFVHRETRRIGARVLDEVAGTADGAPGVDGQLVIAMESALRLVRSDPTLMAWFTAGDAGATAALAQSSVVIEGLVAGFLGGEPSPGVRRRAKWVVRMLVSLLIDPEPDPAEEHAMIAELLVPALTSVR